MENVLLTPQEVNKLERLCKDPFMELGMMTRPEHLQCLEKKYSLRRMTQIIHFERHKHAEKWNKMHEKAISDTGSFVSIALGLVVAAYARTPESGFIAGTVANFYQNAVAETVWYPKMFKEWLLTRRFTFRYEQFPSQRLTMQLTDLIQNEKGKQQDHHIHPMKGIRVGGVSGLPEKIVRDMMTRLPSLSIRQFR